MRRLVWGFGMALVVGPSLALHQTRVQVPAAGLAVIVLFEHNVLAAFDPATGSELQRVTLTSGSTYAYPGRYLAWDGARRRIIALTSDQKGVVAVDLATFAVAATARPAGGPFRTVQIGLVSGSPYLFGDSPAFDSVPKVVGSGAGSLLTVVKLDAELQSVKASWHYRLDPEFDWSVHDAGVSSSEDRVLVSYHGGDTSGLDWFDIAGDSLVRCKTRIHRSRGCMDVHGSFVQSGGTIFAATGSRLIARFESDSVLGFDTTLDQRNHVMEIALDTLTRRIVAVDACFRTGSASVVDLRSRLRPIPPVWDPRSGPRPVPAPSAPLPPDPYSALRTQYCGARIDALNGYFVIADEYDAHVLETTSGRAISTISQGRRIVDVLLVPNATLRR